MIQWKFICKNNISEKLFTRWFCEHETQSSKWLVTNFPYWDWVIYLPGINNGHSFLVQLQQDSRAIYEYINIHIYIYIYPQYMCRIYVYPQTYHIIVMTI